MIADKEDLETRLDAIKRTVSPKYAMAGPSGLGYGVYYRSTRFLKLEVPVLEIDWGDCDGQVVANVMDKHFPDCDMVISRDGFWTPRLFVSDMDSTKINGNVNPEVPVHSVR